MPQALERISNEDSEDHSRLTSSWNPTGPEQSRSPLITFPHIPAVPNAMPVLRCSHSSHLCDVEMVFKVIVQRGNQAWSK